MKLLSGVWLLCFLTMSTACARRDAPSPARTPAARATTISVVATTDLHGRIESLPWLSGHLANLRARRQADGGAVLLVDAGDMFQGTLESNLGEGQAVVRAYNALGYGAAAIGNHEFDYGPVGPPHVPAVPADDPRGALKARAAEASFPFLSANVVEQGRREALRWRNVLPWVVVERGGARIGVVGGTSMGTPRATHPRNFAGPRFFPWRRPSPKGPAGLGAPVRRWWWPWSTLAVAAAASISRNSWPAATPRRRPSSWPGRCLGGWSTSSPPATPTRAWLTG
jgi:hypothetical protein